TSAPKFSVEIKRVGQEDVVVWTKKDIPGRAHPIRENASAQGCGWPEAFRVPVAKDWTSGYYVATLRVVDGGGWWTHRGWRAAENGTGPISDNLEKFIGGGGNVAFFSGNSVCWQVHSEDNGRALACWKQNYFVDPVFATGDFKTLSTAWSHHLLKRPENQLTG